MPSLTRLEKDRALRAAGVFIPPYPRRGPDSDRTSEIESDWALLDAGTAWEEELDRLYAELLERKGENGVHDGPPPSRIEPDPAE